MRLVRDAGIAAFAALQGVRGRTAA